MLFYSAKPHKNVAQDNNEPLNNKEEESGDNGFDHKGEDEDPYNLFPEDVYDIVDANGSCNPGLLNRPPAPLPRPESEVEPERPVAYISRGRLCLPYAKAPF